MAVSVPIVFNAIGGRSNRVVSPCSGGLPDRCLVAQRKHTCMRDAEKGKQKSSSTKRENPTYKVTLVRYSIYSLFEAENKLNLKNHYGVYIIYKYTIYS